MPNLGAEPLVSAITRRQALHHVGAVGGATVLARGSRNTAALTSPTSLTLSPTPVQTTNLQASAGAYVPTDASSGSLTITLPTAPPDQTQVGVSVVAIAAPFAVTIACAGSDVLNLAAGPTSLALVSLNQSALLQYDASIGVWYIQAGQLSLNVASGAARLGTDGTIGGPSGSPLASPVLTAPAHHDLDGQGNLAIGSSFSLLSATAKQNIGLGELALSSLAAGLQNYAIGTFSQMSNQNALENISIGYKTLHLNTSGSHNVAIGDEAMGNAEGGSCCVGVGKISLQQNQGDFNSAVGEAALNANTTGFNNTAIGAFALDSSTSGHNNVAAGYEAGRAVVTGQSNSILGAFAGNTDGVTVTAPTVSNVTLLGFQSQATTSNVIVLGAARPRSNMIFGGVGAGSAFGGGLGVFAIANAATEPVLNPQGGGILYTSGGALKYRGSAGTVTTVANA